MILYYGTKQIERKRERKKKSVKDEDHENIVRSSTCTCKSICILLSVSVSYPHLHLDTYIKIVVIFFFKFDYRLQNITFKKGYIYLFVSCTKKMKYIASWSSLTKGFFLWSHSVNVWSSQTKQNKTKFELDDRCPDTHEKLCSQLSFGEGFKTKWKWVSYNHIKYFFQRFKKTFFLNYKLLSNSEYLERYWYINNPQNWIFNLRKHFGNKTFDDYYNVSLTIIY